MRIPIGLMAAAGTPAFSGVLDSYSSGLWSAFGIKRLLTSYTGNLLRVRRSSDNTEQDIGYLSDGTLDTTALLAFTGAGDGFVVTAYDQSGSGVNFTQATAGSQPRIVSSGVYDGFMRFDGANDYLASSSTSPTNAAFSAGGRYSMRSLAGTGLSQSIITQGNLVVAAHNTWGIQEQNNSGRLEAYLTTGTNLANNNYAIAGTSEVADLYVFDRAASGTDRIQLFRNGSSVSLTASGGTAASPGNYTAETVHVGAYAGALQPNPMNGKWFAVWSNTQASNGAAITSAL